MPLHATNIDYTQEKIFSSTFDLFKWKFLNEILNMYPGVIVG